ncbi:hypothetical protein M885DRAFT_590217 [Pelagophyceae sp. CCMP2097]|nr:hypothetical protein M885DRAFT_590217 [Pelagophyceae sp. CCMP2097]
MAEGRPLLLPLLCAWCIATTLALALMLLRGWAAVERGQATLDFEASLQLVIQEQGRLAHRRLLDMPLVSTAYLFALHYVVPYLGLVFRFIIPRVTFVVKLFELPILARFKLVRGLLSWTRTAVDAPLPAPPVGRLQAAATATTGLAKKLAGAGKARRWLAPLRRRHWPF